MSMAIGVFDGFMEFNADGTFTTFIGANRVHVDPIEYIWKLFVHTGTTQPDGSVHTDGIHESRY